MFTEYVNAVVFNETAWAFLEADPNQVAQMQQQQVDPNAIAAEDPNAAAIEQPPEAQLQPIKKLLLINKMRQLQDKLHDQSISIEELNTLLSYVNYLSYDTLLNVSNKLTEYITQYIRRNKTS